MMPTFPEYRNNRRTTDRKVEKVEVKNEVKKETITVEDS